MPQCVGKTKGGNACHRNAQIDFCWMHDETSLDRQRPVVAPWVEAAPADAVLPENQRDALDRIRQEHGLAAPYCDGAAVVAEPCGHGGNRWICWGCREVIAGLGQAEDPCLDRFQIRAVDQETMDFLCSPVVQAQVVFTRRRA